MSAAIPTGAFGTSIALVDGDFTFVDRDLTLVRDRANLDQALRVIVETPFGSDPVNVTYGFDVAAIFTLAGTFRSIKDVIRLNLVKSLAADDRIREIGSIVFDDEPEFAAIAPELAGGNSGALARRRRSWNAIATVTTIAHDQQRIVLIGAVS